VIPPTLRGRAHQLNSKKTKEQNGPHMKTSLIILAAGKGTRMNSELPKVLHPIAGDPMLVHAMAAGATLEPVHTVVVAGHGAEEVTAAAQDYDETATVVVQSEQLGTAHAVAQARDALSGFDGTAIVLYGDTPFVSSETLEEMMSAAEGADVVVLGFEAADPERYGRLVMDGTSLERIVEFKDASEEERAITLCNSGVIACNATLLFDLIDAVGNENASGEYYLTDIIGLARSRGLKATAVTCDEAETLGVNSRAQLAEAEAAFQARARAILIEDGVTLQAPETVFLARDTVIGRDALIEPNVVFGAGVTIESGAHIRAFSHLEGCHVSRGAVVGPYARLRPGAELEENAKVGNFVEIKNAVLAEGAKVNHLSYIGDAFVGAHANIGAGTITCNYDGVMKHHTHIGANAFIGSNTMLVAPVHIGDGAMTGSGSVITSDVEPDALALARAPQVEKPGMARKLMEMLKAKKAKTQRSS
jgi:bifunctional UDP-N-acetylglucosamine pyrophosphorylase/glucosamine-1-phosphate N-acetyltransferase